MMFIAKGQNEKKRNYFTNKTDVYDIDDAWSSDILEIEGYGPENDGGQ